jgi:ABC-type thiamine transport system ATPase subunit
MSRVELSAVGGKMLVRADLELGVGVHTVVAVTPEGAAELVELTSGVAAPRRGTVLVDGESPYSRPEARRKIGSLLAVEQVFEARSVEAGVARAIAIRGSSIGAITALETFGLSSYAKRSPSSLSPNEARGVALALALTLSERGILTLFEPLATPAGRSRVVTAISDAAREGASVLCVTASARDASDLGGRTFPLRFGRLGGESPLSSFGSGSESTLELVVRTDDPRRLASAVCLDPAFVGLRCDLSSHPGEVVVSGGDPDAVSLAVLRSARSCGAKILALWRRRVGSVRPRYATMEAR